MSERNRRRIKCLDILGLTHRAADDDIRKAYHSLARLHHPDKNADTGAKEKFQEICYAYKYLTGQIKDEDEIDDGDGIPFEVLIRLFPWMFHSEYQPGYSHHEYSFNPYYQDHHNQFPYNQFYFFDDDDDDDDDDDYCYETFHGPRGEPGLSKKEKYKLRKKKAKERKKAEKLNKSKEQASNVKTDTDVNEPPGRKKPDAAGSTYPGKDKATVNPKRGDDAKWSDVNPGNWKKDSVKQNQFSHPFIGQSVYIKKKVKKKVEKNQIQNKNNVKSRESTPDGSLQSGHKSENGEASDSDGSSDVVISYCNGISDNNRYNMKDKVNHKGQDSKPTHNEKPNGEARNKFTEFRNRRVPEATFTDLRNERPESYQKIIPNSAVEEEEMLSRALWESQLNSGDHLQDEGVDPQWIPSSFTEIHDSSNGAHSTRTGDLSTKNKDILKKTKKDKPTTARLNQMDNIDSYYNRYIHGSNTRCTDDRSLEGKGDASRQSNNSNAGISFMDNIGQGDANMFSYAYSSGKFRKDVPDMNEIDVNDSGLYGYSSQAGYQNANVLDMDDIDDCDIDCSMHYLPSDSKNTFALNIPKTFINMDKMKSYYDIGK